MTSSEHVLCVVQARMGSSRLPGKVLADLGGRPMLAFMLGRLASLPHRVVVATSDRPGDDPVAEVAAAAGVAVVRGPEHDVLERFGRALDAHPADAVVRLTGDCPLVDPEIVGAVLERHQRDRADYTCNVLPRTFPKGLDVEVCSAAALRAARKEAQSEEEREHVMPFLYRRPERFRLANVRSGLDLGDECWTVDTAADLERVRDIVAALGGRSQPGWRDVLAHVGQTPRPSPGALRLRPADADDEGALLRWRNDDEAVRFSGTGLPVDPASHHAWVAQRLDDPGTQLWIAMLDRPVGMLRVDVKSGIGEVSIAVDAAARSRGIGRRILSALKARAREDQQLVALRAEVHQDNARSVRLFADAGFNAVGRHGDFLLYTWEDLRPHRAEPRAVASATEYSSDTLEVHE